jgi:hypothetical protein
MKNKIAKLFNGLDRAYGTYKIGAKKGAGRAITVSKPVTAALWEKHLKGEQSIGIAPLRDSSKCLFGAIEVGVDPETIANIVEKYDWPLVTCRNKAGGATVYLFTNQEVPAKILTSKLGMFASAFNSPETLHFYPMLDTVDIDNWVDVPYFDFKKSACCAIKEGEDLSLTAFIKYANSRRISMADLYALEPPPLEFSGAPPCLEHLIAGGFPNGFMDTALYSMGVYARMKYPNDWQRWVHDYNERFMGTIAPQEVHTVIKSLDKKKYMYKCKEDPICSHCNKVLCAEREFGIQSDASPYKGSAGQKQFRPCILDDVEPPAHCYMPPPDSADEPYWVFTINGVDMDVSIDMVQSQIKFMREYLKKFRRVALAIDETRWMKAVNKILEEAVDHDLPPDAGPEGQLRIHLEAFCTGKVQARVKDELLLGKVWRDIEDTEAIGDRIYFRSPDFFKYLEMQRFKIYKMKELYPIFRRWGARNHQFMIKGKCTACWSMLPFEEQTEGFDVPNVQQGDY